jgi:peptide/nickel transport system ATP-binding protein
MLDVSIRLGILNLLDTMRQDLDLALLYVTHDLATVRYFSTRIMVMYRGEVVEHGNTDDVILRPAHPYTQLLAAAAPKSAATRRRLEAARGAIGSDGVTLLGSQTPAPSADAAEAGLVRRASSTLVDRRDASVESGCPFRLRCPHAMEICEQHPPDFNLQTIALFVAGFTTLPSRS